ncbi:hypothetical protein [Thermoflexus hugenholtzii]
MRGGVSSSRVLALVVMAPLALAEAACALIPTPTPPPSPTPIPEPVHWISFLIIGEVPVLAPGQPIWAGPAKVVVRELRREPDGGLRIQGVIEPTGATPESAFNPLLLSVGPEAGLAWAALVPSQPPPDSRGLYARILQLCYLWSEEPPIATRTFSCQWPGDAGPFLGVGLFTIRRGGSILVPIPLQDEELLAVLLAPDGPAPSEWRGRLPWTAAGMGETVAVGGLAVTLLDADWALSAEEPRAQIILALACQGQGACELPSVFVRDQQGRIWLMDPVDIEGTGPSPDQPVSGLIPPGAEVRAAWRIPSPHELPDPNEAVIVVRVTLRGDGVETGNIVENIYLRPVP